MSAGIIQRFKRWYVGPVFGVWMLFSIGYLIHLSIREWAGENPWWLSTVLYLAVHLMVLLWFFWVMPSLLAHDCSAPFLKSPRLERRAFVTAVWMPPFMALFVSAMMLVLHGFDVVGLHARFRAWPISPLLVMAIVGVVLALGAAAIALRLRRVVDRACVMKAAELQRCFECSYDLRHLPGPTCPECGEPIPPQETATGTVGDA